VKSEKPTPRAAAGRCQKFSSIFKSTPPWPPGAGGQRRAHRAGISRTESVAGKEFLTKFRAGSCAACAR